jgi:hypothetical protein
MNSQLKLLNESIGSFVQQFNLSGYGYINGVYNKANVIILTLAAYDRRSHQFLEHVNDILKNQLYAGEIVFLRNGRLHIFDTVNSSNFKEYSITIFKESFENESEYIERLLIFYNNLLEYFNGKTNKNN